MSAPHPMMVVRLFLHRADRRRAFLGALYGLGLGLVGSIVIAVRAALLDDSRGRLSMFLIGFIAGAVGAIAGAVLARMRPLAKDIERRAPESRNLVLTASEMIDSPDRAKPYVTDLVATQAAAAVTPLDLARLYPAKRAFITLGVCAFIWAAGLWLMGARNPAATGPLAAIGRMDGVGPVELLVTPPPYARLQVQRLINPPRVEAIAGSHIRIRVAGDHIRVETADGELTATDSQPKTFEMRARADGFIAVRADSANRRLFGLTVIPDDAPRVRVIAPGKDMFLTDAGRRIPVEIEAVDDISVASLKLRYTKVSGSGERFTFVEGEVPMTVRRSTDRYMSARGTLDLSALGLVPGDMVVYRGAATDDRPGAPVAESDAFIVEITSPGSIATEGFSLDDQQDKYALSQQMVILKTERLLARAPTMSPESLTYYSQMIAAEQRSVRAEFVFMMGGEVAEEVMAAAGITDIDETHEAENEGELAAGRMVNRGRIALVEAIRLMSRASTRLNEANPKAALPEEKAALIALQAAFSRTRYLLRALTLRERLDLSRRLTGVLELAARDARPAAAATADPAVISLRRALAGIAALAGADTIAGSASARAIMIAQQVLQVDPADTTLQRVAASLQVAGRALDDGKSDDSRRALDDAATSLAAALRTRLPREQGQAESPELRRLRGALDEAMRRPR